MVYLIHFNKAFGHARHYIGWTKDESTLPPRVEHHRKGSGARLMAAVSAAGIGFDVVRTWPDGDRAKERSLKGFHGPRLCPVCKRRHAA